MSPTYFFAVVAFDAVVVVVVHFIVLLFYLLSSLGQGKEGLHKHRRKTRKASFDRSQTKI